MHTLSLKALRTATLVGLPTPTATWTRGDAFKKHVKVELKNVMKRTLQCWLHNFDGKVVPAVPAETMVLVCARGVLVMDG